MWSTETSINKPNQPNSPLFPMKRLLIPATLLALTAVSCKTTEANYRNAYETAVEQRQQSTGLDSTIYGRVRRQAITSHLVAGTDTMPLKKEFIGYSENGGASRENVLRYNVVVGQFKQIFNARQMRQRLIDAGYIDAMIVHTREPLYYVLAGTSSTPEETRALWQRVISDKSIVLKDPLPFILTPAHFR